MSDIIINAKVGVSGVNNGAVVVFAQETGTYGRFDPQINQYVSSGTLFSQYDQRFDEYYGGGAASNVAQNIPVTIASGQATSNIIDTKGRQISAIVFPSDFTGGSIKLQASLSSDGTYRDVNQVDSTNVYNITVALGDHQPLDLWATHSLRYVKIVSASSEAIERTLQVVVK